MTCLVSCPFGSLFENYKWPTYKQLSTIERYVAIMNNMFLNCTKLVILYAALDKIKTIEIIKIF